MCCKVIILKGKYLLSHLIGLWAVVQAWECLKVPVNLFYLDKQLTYPGPIGLLQCVGDIVLEGLSHIKLKHYLKVEYDAITEGVPSFGGRCGVQDSKDILPRSVHHSGFCCLLLKLSLVGEKISV